MLLNVSAHSNYEWKDCKVNLLKHNKPWSTAEIICALACGISTITSRGCTRLPTIRDEQLLDYPRLAVIEHDEGIKE